MRLEFKNDYIEPAERKALHNAVRAAVGNRCIRCGHPEGDKLGHRGADGAWIHVPMQCTTDCTHLRDGKLRILTVHHLDGDKANNRWWNLLALCQVCHLQVQARVIPERPWLFPHTAWFRVYVAGFYAWYYGQREVTREEAMAEMDALLALGQPWLYAERRA